MDPATAVLANQEQARDEKAKLDSTSAANKPGPLSKAQLLSAPLDELAREVKVSGTNLNACAQHCQAFTLFPIENLHML